MLGAIRMPIPKNEDEAAYPTVDFLGKVFGKVTMNPK
uniref:Uncharacterized protein n=1 Tax=Gloeothece verrucosa (strain PCC 7822) TaxID=497965 RepID=E0UFU8_GLOV7|nr:hypothetical protein Cyan7822_2353 [Gloeothece verrucosa PCC 7822]